MVSGRKALSFGPLLFGLFFLLIFFRFFLNRYDPYPVILLQHSWQEKNCAQRGLIVQRACGFKNILAHCYWLHILLHSDQIMKPVAANYVFDLASLITDLNPHENVVYRFVAMWLMVKLGRPGYAEQLLQKSLQSVFNADDWRIYFLCAYNAYFFRHDALLAADYLALACMHPNNKEQQLKVGRPEIPNFLYSWERRLRSSDDYALNMDAIKSIKTLQDHMR